MAKSLEQHLTERPVDRERLAAAEKKLLDEVRAYRLRELREAHQLTQSQLAARLRVSQNRISRIEHGDIDMTKVDTLRRYVEAMGGHLRVEVDIGDSSFELV